MHGRESIYVILLVVATTAVAMFQSEVVFAIATGVTASALFLALQRLIENDRFRRYWLAPLLYRNEPIRVSMSYLVIVSSGNDLLLVPGWRFQQFQPVGGVYKYFPEAVDELSRCDFESDTLVAADSDSEGDLRLVVRGRHLLRFLRWFDEGRNREQGPWREFYEELVAPGRLPADVFGCAQFRLLGRRYNAIRRTPYVNMMREVLVADVFELMPNDRQVEALRQLRQRKTSDVLWLDAVTARKRGAGTTTGPIPHIGAHVDWLLDRSALV